jgi:hypothetical protein
MLNVLFQGFAIYENVIHEYQYKLLINGANMEFIGHWNVAGALVRPKGITLNW